jgi:hypothetical protein
MIHNSEIDLDLPHQRLGGVPFRFLTSGYAYKEERLPLAFGKTDENH